MQTGNAALNILLDVGLKIQATTGGDDGTATGRVASGSEITFIADKVTVRSVRQLQDHSAGGDAVEFMRTQKQSQTMTIETKLAKKANAPLLNSLLGSTGAVVNVTIAATGCNTTAVAIVEDFEMNIDIPSTLKCTLRSYGSLWTITAA